ncbi:hypothetical protein C8T65DRAFT_88370 [Cerioporus squamosus]|nr:hypothetical protein C8T65DRAFT_39970 [Cerioporus squamosus]KAI0723713.1 hypothetical protein C8T65DRAFT_88370 [Cerioporus squamosus]
MQIYLQATASRGPAGNRGFSTYSGLRARAAAIKLQVPESGAWPVATRLLRNPHPHPHPHPHPRACELAHLDRAQAQGCDASRSQRFTGTGGGGAPRTSHLAPQTQPIPALDNGHIVYGCTASSRHVHAAVSTSASPPGSSDERRRRAGYCPCTGTSSRRAQKRSLGVFSGVYTARWSRTVASTVCLVLRARGSPAPLIGCLAASTPASARAEGSAQLSIPSNTYRSERRTSNVKVTTTAVRKRGERHAGLRTVAVRTEGLIEREKERADHIASTNTCTSSQAE